MLHTEAKPFFVLKAGKEESSENLSLGGGSVQSGSADKGFYFYFIF